MRLRSLVPLLGAIALAPAPIRADWTAFLPRPVKNGAFVDLYALDESDHLRTGGRDLRWKDLFLTEKLTVFSNGYVYDPRFLTFRVFGTGGLKQEQYDASFLEPQGQKRGSSLEYDLRVTLLPEHPYNLELFATRYEPLFREQYATQHDTISTSRGADFRYRRKPWFFHARASDEKIESAETSSDVQKLILDGKYWKEYSNGRKLSFDAAFSPSRFQDAGGYGGRSTEASFGNLIDFKWIRLSSLLSRSDYSQTGDKSSPALNSRQLNVFELLGADLRENLRADAEYRYQGSSSDYGTPTSGSSAELTSVRRSLELTLHHQLYQSLQTIGSIRWDSGGSVGGRSAGQTESLALNYTKGVPIGRVYASVGGSLADIENAGQTQAVDEEHKAVEVPGAFLLGLPSTDSGSVVVFARSPQAPYPLVYLQENAHYMVSVVGNTLQVAILSLPPEFPLPGKYDFRVSYALAGGDFRQKLKSFNNSASLSLWDNLVTPFYSFIVARSDVVSGTAPGGGLDSQVATVGVSVFKGPLRGRLEFQDVKWDVGPFRALRAEVQYIGALTRTTNTNATADYQNRHFAETFVNGARPAYTENMLTVAGSVQQVLLARALSVSLGGSYALISGLSRSRSYSLHASLEWRLGKLEVSGGASYSNSNTQDQTSYAGERTHSYYFLKLRRILF